MRSVVHSAVLSLALALPAPAALAQQQAPDKAAAVPAEQQKPETPDERLDRLFAELKRTHNEKAAERLAQQIWEEWFKSGSATIDLMMAWSDEAMKERKFDVALDFLDQVIVLQPDYAEGWNRRATVHFMMENYAKSMADIEHTLRLEPRHFGALSGLATILSNSGNKELALRAYERVLDVYPMNRTAQEELGKLADELTGDRI